MNLPVFWRCGGGGLPYEWGFGYWTGPDKDLLCVRETDNARKAEYLLSPICKTKFKAISEFLKKLSLG